MSRSSRQPRRRAATSNTYRFFVDPGAIQGHEAVVDDQDLVHQIVHVLRLQSGDRVLLLDNAGWQYTVILTTMDRGRLVGLIEHKLPAQGEARMNVILYTALLRGERFEWILQKGTELGVAGFVPLRCEHSAMSDAAEFLDHRRQRWQRILREAAEQSCRAALPFLSAPLEFADA